ncbi:serine/threonine-protein phosphatase 4 regulatory subunit 1 isoform X6 [Homo sapiens]|uniref:serine/threonine-protein phosphatase 4 regulatory subunit 1 isoform X6 n=1 Tax=Homo sapiens TaxID=9606 RepID=UPI0005CFF1D4|nr:serine/threonine-protein phosphatase 4 regulatory subunit 1 isoform X6 [Homo sapiens]XP_054175397.1 serine/threonine-protein phosphatase 4 regulatory subunit 1 isoform X6 [Homo sapiens]|eukprot:XP_011524081.1 serine/threonine-protein phosphatase 4 regulatory subunit 1 isoform X4 [Homo sapiens]
MTLSVNHPAAGPWALLAATWRGPRAGGEAALPPRGGGTPAPTTSEPPPAPDRRRHLSLLQEDLQEDADGFGVDDYSSESDVIIIPSALDFVSQDEMLTPLGRLDKYAASENIFNRQMVARSLLDTLREVCDDERDCIAVLERISRLADDSEPTVRAELMEQVPHIALFCQENRPSIPYAFSKFLLPIVVRYLADQNNQVRKTSQAALLALLEQELIERFDVETKVCPVLIELTAPDSNDDVKTEAVAVRQAAFQSLGPFISTFANPSSSGQYFKEESKSSEEMSVENKNRTRDQEAPEDVQVRPEDTPSDLSVSNSSVILENTMEDHAAEASGKPLGEISVPLDSSLLCTLSSESHQEAASNENDKKPGNYKSMLRPEVGTTSQDSALLDQELYNSFHFWRTPLPEIDLDIELEQNSGGKPSPEGPEEESEGPVPSSPNITMATRKELEEMIENLEPHIDDPDVKAQVEVLSAALRASSLDAHEETISIEKRSDLQDELDINELPNCKINQEDSVPLISDAVENMDSTLHYIHSDSDLSNNSSFSPDEERRTKVQDVVPQALLDQYLSMTDPSRAQTVDTEIAKHCAYSLPGVALTLGRQNWHCLRETYETLASDMQWKVRRTLAFSIHELAVILGDQLTAADLVPIFNGFLKDLDEVRIGVLKHLHDFLKLLHIDKRREYLYQLQEFLVTDNSRNWRFRAELAEQLILLLELYSPRDVYDYLRPIALNLCADKVSSVRWISYKLVSEMVKKLHAATPPTFGVDLINELVENFGRCPKWSGRQAFVFVCQTVIEDDCLPMDQFAVHLMPHLLTLANDRVPNVRVLLAKTLRQTLLEKDYFLASASCHQEAVEQTIMALQMDRDSDVKYFASIHPASTKISEDAMSTASSTY